MMAHHQPQQPLPRGTDPRVPWDPLTNREIDLALSGASDETFLVQAVATFSKVKLSVPGSLDLDPTSVRAMVPTFSD